MKVLFINPSPIFGGASTATISIARMLQANGAEVIYSDEYDSLDMRNGLDVDHYPYHGRKFKSHSETIRHIIKDVNPTHVIWTPLVMPYYYFDILKMRKKGIRQLTVIHSISLSQNLKGRMMDYFVSRCLNILDAIVFVSKYTLQSWSYSNAVKSQNVVKKVIYNAVDTPDDKNEVRKPGCIGFVGRFSDEKQPSVFCLFSKDRRLKEFVFHTYGDGPLLNHCKEAFPDVIYHGNVNDINEIYNNIDLLVLTSKFENCPMVILEAMSRRIPCVAPNVGGIPEIVKDGVNGKLYNSYRTDEIADAIEDIIGNRDSYSKGCYECSQAFTFENIGKEWESFLSSL